MAISIDFGTSNTVVARWSPASGKAETIVLPSFSASSSGQPPLVPSLVYVEQAVPLQLQLGQQVLDRGLDLSGDPRYFAGFKRGIGAPIQGFAPELDGTNVTYELAGEWFLGALLAAIPDEPIELVITVPVDSFDTYRAWLTGTCQQLPWQKISLLDESTAAALGYGLSTGNVLVLDFGGGTVDFSLVRLSGKTDHNSKPLGFLLKFGGKALPESSQKPQLAKVLAKAGQNLGGTDIDRWIAEYIAAQQELRVTPLILRLAERLKIQLSLTETASEVLFDDRNFQTYEFHLTRAHLQEILTQNRLFDRLDELLNGVRQQALGQEMDLAQVDAVLLVGGTSQMPAILNWLSQHFLPAQIRQFKPFEAIAHGALEITQGLKVTDFLYHSYGIRYWDRRQNSHNWHRVINAGQPYPMTKPVELVLGASQENQQTIELLLGELGSDSNSTEIYFDGDRLITRSLSAGTTAVTILNQGAENIATLDPPGAPGSDRIRVEFQIDSNRCLRLTVYDLLTNSYITEDRVVAELS
jgi:molecular chaperone DnaK (HSP70)